MTVTATQAARNQANRNLNRWQKMLTAEQARQLPALYAQDGAGLNAIAYVKFFAGGMTWFATEFDPADSMFFGLVISPACPDGELGYFAASEICARQVPSIARQPNGTYRMTPVVERDIHFKPTSLLAAFEDLTGRKHPSAAAAGAVCGCSCDKAAVEVVNGKPCCAEHAETENAEF